MTIKSRLNIIVLLSVITITGLYGYIVKITLDIDQELKDIEIIEKFEDRVSELGLLTEYYLSNPEDRYINAWIQLVDSLEMNTGQVEDLRQNEIVEESIVSIRNSFELILQIKEDPDMYPDPESRTELLNRASTRIRSDIREFMTISLQISQSRFEAIRNLQVDQRLDFLFILIPAIIALLVLAYFMHRHIMVSLNKLQEGTMQFAKGRFDKRIDLHGDDELGVFAGQFNSMAEEIENHIDREKQLNKELKNSNQDLENFASIASHDLKEPLRMIRNFMQMLKKKYSEQLDETANKYIHFAVDGSERMTNLIDDILEFSRVGRYTDFEKADVKALLDDLIQQYTPIIEEKKAEIIYESMPEVKAIPVSLKMVFQNLISNALKYHNNESAPKIDIQVKVLEYYWQFAVSDNGIGIEKKYQEEIFQIFKRLHSSVEFPGSGMGLATCKKIVTQHGGEIWVESEKGKGSTFFFTLKKS